MSRDCSSCKDYSRRFNRKRLAEKCIEKRHSCQLNQLKPVAVETVGHNKTRPKCFFFVLLCFIYFFIISFRVKRKQIDSSVETSNQVVHNISCKRFFILKVLETAKSSVSIESFTLLPGQRGRSKSTNNCPCSILFGCFEVQDIKTSGGLEAICV